MCGDEQLLIPLNIYSNIQVYGLAISKKKPIYNNAIPLKKIKKLEITN